MMLLPCSLPLLFWLTLGLLPSCQGSSHSHEHDPRAHSNRHLHSQPPIGGPTPGNLSYSTVVLNHHPSITRHPTPGHAPFVSNLSGAVITAEPAFKRSLDFESTSTVNVSTRFADYGTDQILPTLSRLIPHTTGIVSISGEGSNERKAPTPPIITQSIEPPVSLLEPASSIPSLPSTSEPARMASSDIFAEPIATSAPPSNIQTRDDHPVPRKGITSGYPLQTNKFFSNFFLGDQAAPTYTFPYSVAWAAGRQPSGSYGIAISHIDPNQRVFGDKKPETGAAAWFINPVGIQSLILSAKELARGANITTDGVTAFSAVVRLRRDPNSGPVISFPLVQGMGFITAIYNGGFPVVQTGVFFRVVTRVSADPKSNVAKFRILLEDGKTWWLYAYKLQGDDLDLQVLNNGYAEAKKPFFGIIQVAKDIPGAGAMLDRASGVYAENVSLSGSVSGSSGRYSFNFAARGHPEGALLMWALPHHVQSFDNETAARAETIYMPTTTKGLARAVLATRWTMVEPSMPVNMSFAPFSPERGSMGELSEAAKSVIQVVAKNEVSQNMIAQSNLDSMYFSGKVRNSA